MLSHLRANDAISGRPDLPVPTSLDLPLPTSLDGLPLRSPGVLLWPDLPLIA